MNLDAAVRILKGESTEWKEGDNVISLDFLEPFNTQMLLAALLAEDIKNGEGVKNYPINSAKSVITSVLNNPSMELITDVYNLTRELGAAETPEEVGSIVGDVAGETAASLIPSFVRQIAQTIDPVRRDASSTDPTQAMMNNLLKNLPFASQSLPAKYGANGASATIGESGWLNAINNFINPATVSTLGDQTITDYLDNLSDSTGSTAFYPEPKAPMKFTVDGKEVLVEGKEMREKYQTTYMKTVGSVYGALISNDAFNSLPDNMQVEILKDAKQYATEHAKASVSDFKMTSWVSNAGENPATTILNKGLIGNAENALSDLRQGWKNNTATSADQLQEVWDIVSDMDDESRSGLIKQATGTTQDFLKAMDSGVAVKEFHDLYKTYTEISNTEKLSASAKATNWGYALDKAVESNQITRKQRNVLFKSLGFGTYIPQEAEKYNQMIDSGLSADESTGLLEKIGAIMPAPGKSQASDSQKFDAIVNFPGLTAAERDAVLRLYMDDKQEAKYDKASNMGISMVDYVEAYSTAHNASGEGKKKRVIAEYQREYGMSYDAAKALYEIFYPTAK